MSLLWVPFSQASVEVFKGEVHRTDDGNSSFHLNFEDSSKQMQDIEIWVTTETKFQGLSTLLELVEGDEVIVTAQKNTANQDRWEADQVELSKVVIRDPGAEVPVSKEIVKEKVDRTQAAQSTNQDLEAVDLENKFKKMDNEIEALKLKVAKTSVSLQEKKDVMMGDLFKKKMAAEAKLSEYRTAEAENKNEIFKAANLLMTDLEESLLATKQELLKVTPT